MSTGGSCISLIAARRLQGHCQVKDAYFLALVAERKGVLATFDRRLADLAGTVLRSALDIVPTS